MNSATNGPENSQFRANHSCSGPDNRGSSAVGACAAPHEDSDQRDTESSQVALFDYDVDASNDDDDDKDDEGDGSESIGSHWRAPEVAPGVVA